jgi:hypothetical protein
MQQRSCSTLSTGKLLSSATADKQATSLSVYGSLKAVSQSTTLCAVAFETFHMLHSMRLCQQVASQKTTAQAERSPNTHHVGVPDEVHVVGGHQELAGHDAVQVQELCVALHGACHEAGLPVVRQARLRGGNNIAPGSCSLVEEPRCGALMFVSASAFPCLTVIHSMTKTTRQNSGLDAAQLQPEYQMLLQH